MTRTAGVFTTLLAGAALAFAPGCSKDAKDAKDKDGGGDKAAARPNRGSSGDGDKAPGSPGSASGSNGNPATTVGSGAAGATPDHGGQLGDPSGAAAVTTPQGATGTGIVTPSPEEKAAARGDAGVAAPK